MSDETQPQNATGDSLPPGTPLLKGQFLIERFLNSGGFGITYLARDSLDRRVVLKECFPSSMCCRSREDVRARSRMQQREFDTVVRLFGQEARRLSKLAHPNIVGVRDVFEENGTAYMALDYVEGRDLLDVIEHEGWRLRPDDVREITRQLLEAVRHVHARGILHRDISPDNILLDAENRPILIDFGAARDTARRSSRVLSALHVVKDGYSPQEFYVAGSEQGPASDLYALAATLYHVLVGETPVHGQVRLAAMAEGKPDPYLPLAGRVADHDAAFLSAIDKTLSVFPKTRLQSADDWLAMIDDGADAPELAPETVDQTILRLVEDTNAVVRVRQQEAEREAAERARAEEAARLEQEARRRRILEEARLEALELEAQARQAAQEALAREQAREAEAAEAPVVETERQPAPEPERPSLLRRLFGWPRWHDRGTRISHMKGVGT